MEPSLSEEASLSLVKVYRGVRYEVHALPQGRCHCNGITFASLSAAAVSIVQQLPMLASYNVPALLAKAPNLISLIPDASMKDLFRLVCKKTASCF